MIQHKLSFKSLTNKYILIFSSFILFFSILLPVNAHIVGIEQGSRQETEGRRKNWMGIQTPTSSQDCMDGGVLYSLFPLATGRGQESVFSSAFCLLPSNVLDNQKSINYNNNRQSQAKPSFRINRKRYKRPQNVVPFKRTTSTTHILR